MRTSTSATTGRPALAPRLAVAVFCAIVIASIAGVSAHFVRGLESRELARAFASSPSDAADPLIKVMWGTRDTGLRVACFYVANSSLPHSDGWPRITGVGFELPGSPSGFSLLSPLDGDWEIVEGVQASLEGHDVTLDFVIRARVNPTGRTPGRPDDPRGIPPGQGETRGSGTRFCVSGPFPDTLPGLGGTTIERILNGVVVGFNGVDRNDHGIDAGVWFPTPTGTTGPGPIPRDIPLYP